MTTRRSDDDEEEEEEEEGEVRPKEAFPATTFLCSNCDASDKGPATNPTDDAGTGDLSANRQTFPPSDADAEELPSSSIAE